MDAVGAAIISGAGAIFTGTLAPTVLFITSRLDRKARNEAEEREQQALRQAEARARQINQQHEDLQALRVLSQEQRAELERKDRENDALRQRDSIRQSELDKLQERLADEISARQLAEREWTRLHKRYPDD